MPPTSRKQKSSKKKLVELPHIARAYFRSVGCGGTLVRFFCVPALSQFERPSVAARAEDELTDELLNDVVSISDVELLGSVFIDELVCTYLEVLGREKADFQFDAWRRLLWSKKREKVSDS